MIESRLFFGGRMEPHLEAMVKSLVAVAWADGRLTAAESQVLDGILEAFEIGGADADAVRGFAKSPRTLDDVPLTELSADDRRLLLHHAVIVTYVDGTQSDKEVAVLKDLAKKLRLPDDEAGAIMKSAGARAQAHKSLL